MAGFIIGADAGMVKKFCAQNFVADRAGPGDWSALRWGAVSFRTGLCIIEPVIFEPDAPTGRCSVVGLS